MTSIREELGPDIVLGLDYHHRLTVPETVSLCDRLVPGALDFLEEPIRSESASAYRVLRRAVRVPLALGEECASKWAFAPLIEEGLLDYARVDLGLVGGLTEALKVAALCEAHYVDVMPHNPLGPVATAASAHFALAIPNFLWLEIRRSETEDIGAYDAGIFPVQQTIDGQRLVVSTCPGLGVEVDETRLAEPFTQVIEPRLSKSHGSHSNW